MRITIVEDDPMQLENVKEILSEAFEGADFASFSTASEYLQALPSFVKFPPDIFLFDVMLPWKSPGSSTPPPHQGWNSDRAGLALIDSTRNYEAFSSVPAIVWTVIHSEQIAISLPSRTVFISKQTPSHHLVTVIRSLLMCAGSTPMMRDSKWRTLVTASELKPSIYGVSLDLKKVWSIFKRKPK